MSSGRSPRRPPKTRPTVDMWRASATDPLQVLLDRPGTPPLLAQAVQAIPWQTRNLTPFSRVATSPGFAPQALAALLALGGSVVTDPSTPASALPIEAFLARASEATPSEIQVSLADEAWGSASVARTPADSPIVAAFAVVRITGGEIGQARIALTGVWPEPARLARSGAQLVGQALTEDTIAATAAAIAEECSPVGDFLGSEEYRRAMAAVVTARALEACAGRSARSSEAGS